MTTSRSPTDRATSIEVAGLSKDFGAIRAVDDLSFAVRPARVTGFLGPNGAGKTTTLRMLLGLVTPTVGTATIDGIAYRDLVDPIGTVGAALEAASFHPGRTARNHLRVLAAAAGIATARVDTVLELVGLSSAADRRTGGYSLGMRQRLALAATMLGDPRVLVLDEPANGLDPEGIAWLRGFLRHLAHGEGRTVLVSSHVLSEVEQTVDEVVIIARGRLVRAAPLAELSGSAGPAVLVGTPTPRELVDALRGAGLSAEPTGDGLLRVGGVDAAAVGNLAFLAGIEVHELRTETTDLERLFLSLTADEPLITAGPAVPSQSRARP
jgi:ABC-2 type transport system ATP-binding protein